MSHPVRTISALAGLLALSTLVGCGGGSSPAASSPVGSSPGASSAVASVPATDAPVATTDPAAGAVEPSEKLIASDGRIIVHPPGWWTKEDLGIVYVVSSEAAANRLVGSGTLSPGDVYVQFAQNTILPGGTSDPAVHLPDNLKLLLEGLSMTGSAPATLTVAGKPAARVDASNDRLEIVAISVKENDETFADVIAYGAPGEKAALETLVLKMVEGLTYP